MHPSTDLRYKTPEGNINPVQSWLASLVQAGAAAHFTAALLQLNVAPKWPLASTQPAIIPGLELGQEDLHYKVPTQVYKQLEKYGFGWHLLLVHLTDDAVLHATSRGHTKSQLEFDVVLQTLKAEERILSKDSKDWLSVAKWKQGWLRLLQLKQQYLPGKWWKWEQHMKQIENAPNALSTQFAIWLQYNIAVWRRATCKGLDPTRFHKELWDC
jgi:hypothetical protein